MKKTALALAVILSVFCLTACGSGKNMGGSGKNMVVNMDDYVQIEVAEDGTAKAVYDEEQFLEDFGDVVAYTDEGKIYQYTENGTPAEVLWNLYIGDRGFLSQSKGLKNGDEITLIWREDRTAEAEPYFNVELTYTEGSVSVIAEGIEEEEED